MSFDIAIIANCFIFISIIITSLLSFVLFKKKRRKCLLLMADMAEFVKAAMES